MKVYENSFVQGRELAKKLSAGVVISCILSLVASGISSSLQFALIGLTAALFALTIYVIIKYCRCPHCGKHIILGCLAVTVCPACKRNLVTGKREKKNNSVRR